MSEPRLKTIFSEVLDIPLDEISDTLEYAKDARWDSVAHMALIAGIDESFDIMMETPDILDMSSFAKAKEILTKYDVDF